MGLGKTIHIPVEIGEVLDELSDEELLKELNSRKSLSARAAFQGIGEHERDALPHVTATRRWLTSTDR